MTKIKDLVSVTVPQAFQQFPIDNERYELIVALDEILAGRLGLKVFNFKTIANDAVNQFVLDLDETIDNAVSVYYEVRRNPTGKFSRSDITEYKRVEAFVTAHAALVGFMVRMTESYEEGLCLTLLDRVIDGLREPDAIKRSARYSSLVERLTKDPYAEIE